MSIEENIESPLLGGLVEFFSYITVFDEPQQLFTAYTPSYPNITAQHADATVALALVKQKLAGQDLNEADSQ